MIPYVDLMTFCSTAYTCNVCIAIWSFECGWCGGQVEVLPGVNETWGICLPNKITRDVNGALEFLDYCRSQGGTEISRCFYPRMPRYLLYHGLANVTQAPMNLSNVILLNEGNVSDPDEDVCSKLQTCHSCMEFNGHADPVHWKI